MSSKQPQLLKAGHSPRHPLVRALQQRRSWVLGLMLAAPLLFLAVATSELTARAALLPWQSDLLPAAAGQGGGSGGSSARSGGGGGRRHGLRRRLGEEGASSTAAGTQQEQPAAGGQEPPVVWLYTLLGADYEGTAELLPHWLRHYLGTLGFSKNRLLVVVNHNSTRPEAAAEFQEVQAELARWGVAHHVWTGRYSSDAHLKVKLQLLQERVGSVEDWIVIADSDEFHTYTGAATITELLRAAEQGASNWVQGQMVDRVASSGELAAVKAEPSIFEQFPLNCHVVKRVTHGSVWKVVAAKAYWRTSTGNHYVVDPDKARAYFGAAQAGVRGPRNGWFGAEDLWPFTPYATHSERYQRSTVPEDPSLWRLSKHPTVMPVLHFKWHDGILQSAADRYEHYRGNASVPGGLPRYRHYNESLNILEALAGGRIDLQAAQCSTGEARLALLPPSTSAGVAAKE